MQYVQLPSHLQEVFFETRWETAKVWALQTPVTSLSLSELDWHLDLTVWSTVSGEPRFDLAPRRVLAEPSVYPRRWARICAASLGYALELFLRNERWVIVDGYHRLAKHRLEATVIVPVRLHPAALWYDVRPETSITLPSPIPAK